MVQDVFSVSKAASGQLAVEMEEIDFGKLLRQTLALIRTKNGWRSLTQSMTDYSRNCSRQANPQKHCGRSLKRMKTRYNRPLPKSKNRKNN